MNDTDDSCTLGELWAGHKEHDRARRMANLAKAEKRVQLHWKKHTEWHWSHMLNGERIDYYPTKNKFVHNRKVMHGDPEAYIFKRSKR